MEVKDRDYAKLFRQSRQYKTRLYKCRAENIELKSKLKKTRRALELASKDVCDLTQNQTGVVCYECEHFDLCNKLLNVDELELECEQVFAKAYLSQAEQEAKQNG